MFEKDVLQLIRGLRSHKGAEREYIQAALRECKKEIKSNDMDQKATALLKLVYLEMFGHDMGWASFNVLEVMSSQKYPHKRIGYLAAVQSFRPDTEVLMLAENLLKKDLTSPDKSLIHLPLNAIPHLINPSMANSLLADLLPRLSHSHPAVRKKTIVTLYRLAVVYPETLRPAWPKIKERLLDEDEDPTVTAAIINVVCELGWRRPQDFLPLAPRLFELLTQGGNNWMAIKIIKLFSQLTPLEPRLVRKLLPPLTGIIKTTPAMSLLYECINGIIQGGIMEVAAGTTEGDEVARLCVSKLRAMLVVQGDPNLRYVALLAFAKITASHADLVADHQDVILECIDDADISIRTRALDLVVDMVNGNNLQMVVERLLKQLKTAGKQSPVNEPENDRAAHEGVIPMADDDDDDMPVKKKEVKSDQPPPLPEDYRQSVIERILEMCSKNNYSNMDDFEWYITVLVELVKQCPSVTTGGNFGSPGSSKTMADAIGDELRNVAVRVKGVRPEAAAAAQSLLLLDNRDDNFAQAAESAQNVLAAAAFIAGEYSSMLPDAEAVLASLVHSTSAQLPTHALASYIQAIPKVLGTLTSDEQIPWTASRRSDIVLLMARITHFLEPLNLHPSLEIQERAVEYLDLMRLASEAVSAQQVDSSDDGYAEPPLLLTQAIPSLFSGTDLNPVAPNAVRNVAAPEGLDLDAPINISLNMILQQADYDTEYDSGEDEVRRFYYEKPSMVKTNYNKPAADRLEDRNSASGSYQEADRESLLDPEALERKRAERRERYRDDPYYIDSERNSGTSTPMHSILRSANGSDLDVDSIPVMELKLDSNNASNDKPRPSKPKTQKKPKRHFEITSDETLDSANPNSSSAPVSYTSSPSGHMAPSLPPSRASKKSVLEFNSAGLSALSLEESSSTGNAGHGNASSKLEYERRLQEEEELAKAMKEVERLRLEMQRQAERVEEPEEEGTVVKRKSKKKARSGVIAGGEEGQAVGDGAEEGVKKKKKKKKVKASESAGENAPAADDDTVAHPQEEGEEQQAPVKTKKKKKRQVTFDEA